MPPRTKLLIGIVIVVVLLAAAFFALRGSDALPGSSSTPRQASTPAKDQLPSATTPTRPDSAPQTIADDLTNVGARDIDHRGMSANVQMEKAPALAFTYERTIELPTLPVETVPVTEYEDINQDYANALAKRFGFRRPSLFPRADVYDIAELDLQPGSGSLRVSRTSGYAHFTLIVPGAAVTPVRTRTDAVSVAAAFLERMELSDPSFLPANTYERRDAPGIIFVEYHRAWDPLPIFQPLGLVSSTIRTMGTSQARDAAVIRTSDKTDGMARPGDFNTVTVGVDTDGRITEVVSNLRPIKRVIPGRVLRGAEESWAALVAGTPTYTLVIPSFAERSTKTWEELFPNGTATSSKAVVKEALLAYIELPSTQRQQYLQPAYIFRGSATLESGVTSDFVVAVPALADSTLPTP